MEEKNIETESIFDLTTDITNLIVKHGLEEGEYAFVYRNKQLMVVDLSKIEIPEEKLKDLQVTE